MVGSFEIRADLYRYYNRGLRVEEQGLLRHSSKEHSLAKDTKTPIFLLSLLPRSRVTVDFCKICNSTEEKISFNFLARICPLEIESI